MIKSSELENKSITLRNDSKVELNGVHPGQSVEVKVDRKGVPLERFWRNRLRDAEYDNCVSNMNEASKKKQALKTKGE